MPPDLRDLAASLARRLHQAGHTAYFAGGCVRDFLLGHAPGDYDIATDATPDRVVALFPGAKLVGAHFGVVVVRAGGHEFEIATFRTDGSYRDGRHPESVAFSTPEEDAARRDFTVNGLFQDPADDRILDFVGGRADLYARLLRAIGDPARRFSEDHLRLLRAVRFATTLDGFTIETVTWAALTAAAPSVATVAPERVRVELCKIFAHPNRRHGFDLLVDSGIMAVVLPEILTLKGCEQPPQWHPEGDVFTHTRLMLGLLPPDAPQALVWAVLLHDIAKPATSTTDENGRIRFNGHDRLGAEMAEAILRRLRFPNELIGQVVEMVRQHMNFMNVQQMRVATLKQFMARPTFDWELALHHADCLSSNGLTDNYEFLLAKREEFSKAPLVPPRLLTGDDLIAAGHQPGPALGRLLAEIQALQLDGTLSSRADALDWLHATHPPHTCS